MLFRNGLLSAILCDARHIAEEQVLFILRFKFIALDSEI
jgi:hypothetical protein